MFDKCTSLVRGPKELPATNLGKTCYRNMFYGCTSLEYAPELLATSISSGAFQRMFWGCTKLNKIKMLCKGDYINNAFVSDNTNWCAGVAASGEIWLDPSLKEAVDAGTTWGTIIPAGWTPKYIGVDAEP